MINASESFGEYRYRLLNDLVLIQMRIRLLGTPTPEIWPSLVNMPDFKLTFPKWRPQHFHDVLPEMEELGLHLLNSMLVYDPSRRLSGKSF